jgi:hypothetical protein
MAGEDRLVVQRLDGETLVYDRASDEAHLLQGAAAVEFEAAGDEVSRRQVLRRATLAGVAAASGGLLLKTIVAPIPAQAQSPIPCGGTTCDPATQECCFIPATSGGAGGTDVCVLIGSC